METEEEIGLEEATDEQATGEAEAPEGAADAEPEQAAEAPEPEPEADDENAPEYSDEELERAISALLFASPDPLSLPRLRKLLGGIGKPRIEQAFEHIRARLRDSGLPWELRPIAGGWQFYTTPDMSETVLALSKVKKDERVSPASLETLAVVAYRQPVTKAEIEAIRGVQVGPVLRALVDRGLVKVAGRAEVPGNPLIYQTTKKFLESFGLMALDDLPRDAELLRD